MSGCIHGAPTSWTAKIITVTELSRRTAGWPCRLAVCVILLAHSDGAPAQGVRDRTRPTPDRSTAVSDSQANELTLTLSDVSIRPIQVWIRAAGVADNTGRTLTATLSRAEGALVKIGQRVRAFSPESRASMYQARITRIRPKGERVIVTAVLAGPGREDTTRYVLEIVASFGDFLSVPNEAIIETGGTQVVYVPLGPGRYVPREIRVGAQGELFTQVLEGLQPGEQVVTFGSFFIDAEYQLKGS